MRTKLGKAPLVEKPNPLGDTLELLLGAAAAALTAWQQAVVAAVFELCLVGVMAIYELLGQNAGGRATMQDKADPAYRQPDRESIPTKAVAKASPSPAGRSRPKPAPVLPSVKAFIGERVSPADGRYWWRVLSSRDPITSADRRLDRTLKEIDTQLQWTEMRLELYREQRATVHLVKGAIASARSDRANTAQGRYPGLTQHYSRARPGRRPGPKPRCARFPSSWPAPCASPGPSLWPSSRLEAKVCAVLCFPCSLPPGKVCTGTGAGGIRCDAGCA